MIRVVLPQHLRTLAKVDGDIELDIEGKVTIRRLLDELETEYPALRGTVRDHATKERRAYVRFFAREEDLSLLDQDTLLPDEVTCGDEPFFIIGAISGGSCRIPEHP